jgi:hypothetical protein
MGNGSSQSRSGVDPRDITTIRIVSSTGSGKEYKSEENVIKYTNEGVLYESLDALERFYALLGQNNEYTRILTISVRKEVPLSHFIPSEQLARKNCQRNISNEI